jgi:CheY-like chemotaxis protein
MDGVEALDRWRYGGFGLVFTDLHMPGMDGYALVDAIRHEEAGGAQMPVVALTANALIGEAARAQAAGMQEYLTKPLRLESLRTTIERWLG